MSSLFSINPYSSNRIPDSPNHVNNPVITPQPSQSNVFIAIFNAIGRLFCCNSSISNQEGRPSSKPSSSLKNMAAYGQKAYEIIANHPKTCAVAVTVNVVSVAAITACYLFLSNYTLTLQLKGEELPQLPPVPPDIVDLLQPPIAGIISRLASLTGVLLPVCLLNDKLAFGLYSIGYVAYVFFINQSPYPISISWLFSANKAYSSIFISAMSALLVAACLEKMVFNYNGGLIIKFEKPLNKMLNPVLEVREIMRPFCYEVPAFLPISFESLEPFPNLEESTDMNSSSLEDQ